MKFIKALIVAAPILLLVSGSAFGVVVGSKHDLSNANNPGIGNGADGGQVCVYCHTPHNSLGDTNGPLWNHNTGSTITSYSMYDSNTFDGSSSMQATPGPESLACLSCHDGTVALDSIANAPGQGDTWVDGAPVMQGYALVGTVTGADLDLGNDHPIAFTYDSALALADGGLNDPASISPLVLFGDSLECATCHDVHDDTIVSFLRVSPGESLICTTCHAK